MPQIYLDLLDFWGSEVSIPKSILLLGNHWNCTQGKVKPNFSAGTIGPGEQKSGMQLILQW